METTKSIRQLETAGKDRVTVKVLDDNSHSYFFCTPAHARILLKQKKAKKIEGSPVLTIQLTTTK
jgi:hypothetical protein